MGWSGQYRPPKVGTTRLFLRQEWGCAVHHLICHIFFSKYVCFLKDRIIGHTLHEGAMVAGISKYWAIRVDEKRQDFGMLGRSFQLIDVNSFSQESYLLISLNFTLWCSRSHNLPNVSTALGVALSHHVSRMPRSVLPWPLEVMGGNGAFYRMMSTCVCPACLNHWVQNIIQKDK